MGRIGKSKYAGKIHEILRAHPEGLRMFEIAKELNTKQGSINQLMYGMVHRGELAYDRGRYTSIKELSEIDVPYITIPKKDRALSPKYNCKEIDTMTRKIVDMNEAGKKLSDRQIKEATKELRQLNKIGMTTEELLNTIDETCKYIKVALLDFYMSQYDNDEPGVARHNLQEACNDLKDVASGECVVPARTGNKFLPVDRLDLVMIHHFLSDYPIPKDYTDLVEDNEFVVKQHAELNALIGEILVLS